MNCLCLGAGCLTSSLPRTPRGCWLACVSLGAFSLPVDARIWGHGCCTRLVMLLQFVLHSIRAWCSGESWYQDRKLQIKPFSMEKLGENWMSICRRGKRRRAGTWTCSCLVFCWLFSANDPSKFVSRGFIMSLLKQQTFHCSSAHDSKCSTHPQRAQFSPWLPLFPWEATRAAVINWCGCVLQVTYASVSLCSGSWSWFMVYHGFSEPTHNTGMEIINCRSHCIPSLFYKSTIGAFAQEVENIYGNFFLRKY